VLTVYCTKIPAVNKTPSSGTITSLVAVVDPTELIFIKLVPEGLVVKKSTLPAFAVLVKKAPFNRALPAKITSEASALMPAFTLPAGSPTAVILAIVKKKLLLVATPAFAPVTVSV